jgi:hypothetical protein
MSGNRCFSAAVLTACALVAGIAAVHCNAQDDAKARHRWERIEYPSAPAPWDQNDRVRFLVGSGQGDDKAGFRVYIQWTGSGDSPATGRLFDPKDLGDLRTRIEVDRKKLPDPKDILVQVHMADGTVIKPNNAPPAGWVGTGNQRAMTWSVACTFPWGPNTLDEAWVEVKFPQRTYWLEIPYGFTRDPEQPLAPPIPNRSRPAFAPAMKALPKDDIIVTWSCVEYDLGVIQNNWRLSLKLSNPCDLQCEMILFRGDIQIGKSMYLWELHSPRTSVSLKLPGGDVLENRGLNVRVHDDGMRRSDTFQFNECSTPGRSWGALTATVDDKSYTIAVPSSMFKRFHGVARVNAQVPSFLHVPEGARTTEGGDDRGRISGSSPNFFAAARTRPEGLMLANWQASHSLRRRWSRVPAAHIGRGEVLLANWQVRPSSVAA